MKRNKVFKCWFICLFAGVVLFFSCNDDNEDQLVYVVGGGNSSAKVGSSAIVFKDTLISNILNSYNTNYTFSSIYSISLTGVGPNSTSLNFLVNINPSFIGSYILNGNPDNGPNSINGVSLLGSNGGTSSYITDSIHTGVLTINSYNPQLEIISGTFYFTAAHYNSTTGVINNADTIVVSNGSFVSTLHYYIQQI